MSTTFTKSALFFILLVLSVSAANAQDHGQYSSPQTTFETAQKASAAKDYKKFCHCFTDDGLSLLAGSLRMASGMMEWAGKQPDADASSARISKGIARINRRFVKTRLEAETNFNLNASSDELIVSVRKMAQPIIDQPGYVVAVFKLIQANSDRSRYTPPWKDAKLHDLKVHENLATATISGSLLSPGNTRSEREPIVFRRVGNTWKIEQVGKYGIEETTSDKPSIEGKVVKSRQQRTFDQEGLATIHRAARDNDLAALRSVLSQGTDVNLQQRYQRGTALHYAAEAGHQAIVQELLKHRANKEARDTRGYTPLMRAAKQGRTTVIRVLLDAGANIDSKPDVGEWTALCLAIHGKHRESVQLLLDRGASFPDHKSFALSTRRLAKNLGIRLPDDKTLASTNSRRSPVKSKQLTLPSIEKLKPIDRPNDKGFSKLHLAAMRGDITLVEDLLIEGADVNARQRKFHGTPLQYAASAGRLNAVKLLIKYKAAADTTDTHGRTPLMWAASKGHVDVVGELLNSGANINQAAKGGWTALHYAADKQHFEAAQLLIERGASVKIKNSQGKTPLDLNPNLTPTE